MALQYTHGRIAGLIAAAVVVTAVPAQAQRAGVGIEDAWVQGQAGNADSAAGYLTVRNPGRVPLVIKGMRCADVANVVIVETVTERRISRREGRDSLVVPPGGFVPMRPGGLHLLMGGIRPPLSVGARLACRLLTSAGDVTVNVAIRAPEARRADP